MKKYLMTITPAMKPIDRHFIQDALIGLGYKVSGGGTLADMSVCDISFYREGGEKMAKKKPEKPIRPPGKRPIMGDKKKPIDKKAWNEKVDEKKNKWPKLKKAPVVTKKPKKKK